MISQKKLKSILHYNPDTGVFTWLVNKGLRVVIGSMAGCSKPDGYRTIGIDSRGYMAHRLAFLYMNGKFPEYDVDHINGIRSDNRWENLRRSTRAENLRNRKIPNTNKSGAIGVSRHTINAAWRASVCINGKQVHTSFSDSKYGSKEKSFAEAKKYVITMREKLGYHSNHGRGS